MQNTEPNQENKPNQNINVRRYLKIFLIAILIIFLFPIIFTIPAICERFNFTQTGQIGDTIGGIMGPFIAIVAAGLTFLAFYVQYKANEIQIENFKAQRAQFEKQSKDTEDKNYIERKRFEDQLNLQKKQIDEQKKAWEVEQFENKFFEMLRLHRTNVEEMEIEGVGTRKLKRECFETIYIEFRYIYWYCYNYHKKHKTVFDVDYTTEELIRLAYIFLYCGATKNSEILSNAMNVAEPYKFKDDFFKSVRSELERVAIYIELCSDKDGNNIVVDEIILLRGHHKQISHYYRHLFQTVNFVAKQPEELIDKNKKLDYLRILRAQLSDYEQIMLYYNALAHFGERWIKDKVNGKKVNYFTDYRMIHNIPLPLANFGIEPHIKFAKELEKDSKLFEWLE